MFEDMLRSSTVLRRLGTISGNVIRVTSPRSFMRAIADDKDYAEWCVAILTDQCMRQPIVSTTAAEVPSIAPCYENSSGVRRALPWTNNSLR